MLFNSLPFIFAFLPASLIVYFLLNYFNFYKSGKLWLCIASLFFYGYWDISYLPLLLLSIMINFTTGTFTSPYSKIKSVRIRKSILFTGIAVNLLVLAYYKYTNFFIDNINSLSGSDYTLKTIILPLGISFFTFTQIAFLIDSFKGKAIEYNFINYILFVTFFPHLIAGPILHHGEMMPQFDNKNNAKLNFTNIMTGLLIFSIGLVKKVIIADTFATFAQEGYTAGYVHDFYSAWATSLSYTFQLYFDFSGYCDMAIGAALLFNIMLPINFNSPYKALDIQDFWRRWHITLGRYLRDYVYIPLGGNRVAPFKVYINLFITFSIAGLWHGASWMFILWGSMHGAALIVHRVWNSLGMKMLKPLAWFTTFMFINVSWVFFRAENLPQAFNILKNMFTLTHMRNISLVNLPLDDLSRYGKFAGWVAENISFGMAAYLSVFLMSALALLICSRDNSQEQTIGKEAGYFKVSLYAVLSAVAVYFTLHTESAVFLYFNF
jgi:D-alanyl-lipoteichoic acid acyltransferase DltB (MBOAT superfamily)